MCIGGWVWMGGCVCGKRVCMCLGGKYVSMEKRVGR